MAFLGSFSPPSRLAPFHPSRIACDQPARWCTPVSSATPGLQRRAVLRAAAALAAATIFSSSTDDAAFGADATGTGNDAIAVEDIVVGTGPSPTPGQLVSCHYVLTLDAFESDGGRIIDSSRSHPRPFAYTYGVGQVIKGWDEAVSSMHVGGRRRIIIPPSLGYGARKVGPIPSNSTLYFDIELLSLNS
jgi:peptidylprolyl isomerase